MYQLIEHALRDRRVQFILSILFFLGAFWFGSLALLESSPSVGVTTQGEVVSHGRNCSYNEKTLRDECTDYTIVRFIDRWDRVQQMQTAGYLNDSVQVRYLPVPFFANWFAIVEPNTPVMVGFMGFMALLMLVFGAVGIGIGFVPELGNLNWIKKLDTPAFGYAFFGLLLIVCCFAMAIDWLQKPPLRVEGLTVSGILFVFGLIVLSMPLWNKKTRH